MDTEWAPRKVNAWINNCDRGCQCLFAIYRVVLMSTLLRPSAHRPSAKAKLSSAVTVIAATMVLTACGGSDGPNDTPAPAPVTVTKAADKVWSTARALGPGVNFGNMLEAPNEGDWGLKVDPEYIQVAWNAGFRTVRLPVRWSNHASTTYPYTVDKVFLERVATVVDQLLSTGFYVVLNMHHYSQLDGDSLEYGEYATDELTLDERYIGMWDQIGHRFANHSDKLLFELYNEPHTRLTATKWNQLASVTLQQVRVSNPQRIVVVDAPDWANPYSLGSLVMPQDAYLIASVHHYAPFTFTHQGATWVTPVLPTGVTCCTTEQSAEIANAVVHAKAWSDAKGYPVFIGEFGSYSAGDMASRVNYTRQVKASAASAGMPWAYWEFAGGFGVYDPTTKTLRTELANALLAP